MSQPGNALTGAMINSETKGKERETHEWISGGADRNNRLIGVNDYQSCFMPHAVAAWPATMSVVMPMSGAGFVGNGIGMSAPVATLILAQ
ncbi:MAG: hypothetical protein KKB37_15990 [Alphaproteobacteria bacterium]|nr:hypothetical protein [Alphaproteobacteria bacterium]